MPVQIPEEIEKKILIASVAYPAYQQFKEGAYFGFSLSQQQLEEKEKEIIRLKNIIYTQFTFYHDEPKEQKTELWQQFKEQNNLT